MGGQKGPYIIRVTAQTFYALQDTKTPAKAAALAVAVNIILSLILEKWGQRPIFLSWLNARRANPRQIIFGMAGMQSCLGKEGVLLQDLKTGHFYFGKNGTFLNWLDNISNFSCFIISPMLNIGS